MAERVLVEDPELGGEPVDAHQVVDLQREVRVRRRLSRALEDVHLQVPDAQPLHRIAEVRGRHRLQPEHVHVEPHALVEVAGDHADVVQRDCRRHAASPSAISAA